MPREARSSLDARIASAAPSAEFHTARDAMEGLRLPDVPGLKGPDTSGQGTMRLHLPKQASRAPPRVRHR
jgi:hypothetical protein